MSKNLAERLHDISPPRPPVTTRSGRVYGASIPCLMRERGVVTKGIDEAQLFFFPFVTEPSWYEAYWYRNHEGRKPARSVGRLLAWLVARASLRRPRARQNVPAEPGQDAGELEIARSLLGET
jgi:hypothetical protein